MATVFDRLKKLIIEQLGVEEEQVVPNASFVDDLNADSLDLVELIMSMEEEFSDSDTKIEIPDEDAEKIVTVQDAIDYLRDNGIELHPWYNKEFPDGRRIRSLGCAPCTVPIYDHQQERNGRWQGTSKCGGECGIHTQVLK